ncbi:Apurinic/apyrimidinic endonuclease [Trachipleistophora hominis]|uniref:Apurinic/apyrimidinic endonuclease n=1 Tax=Trachipleistophora hominis TaxID=72359 RepID=L7JT38_TRAHO|nr:Apurinic/apyrimidinic endonuclease [Trachipleistophora hominis]
MLFRLVSFNVNGLRSYSKFISERNTNINDYVRDRLKATILCVQESRGSKSSLSEFYSLKDYIVFVSANRANSGKYGVATFIKKDFFCCGKQEVMEEFREYNGEGRFLLTRHGSFDILNCYFPFVSESEFRSDDEVCRKKVNNAMRFYHYVEQYVNNNPNTIVCGDFNAVYSLKDTYIYQQEFLRIQNRAMMIDREMDGIVHAEHVVQRDDSEHEEENETFDRGRFVNPIASPTELPFFFKNEKYLREYFFELPSRKWLYKMIHECELIDTYRMYSNKEKVYSCWNSLLGLRKVNLGTRIDLILVHKMYVKCVKNADVMMNEYGSDHCPVYADFEVEIVANGDNILKRNNNLLSFFKPKL